MGDPHSTLMLGRRPSLLEPWTLPRAWAEMPGWAAETACLALGPYPGLGLVSAPWGAPHSALTDPTPRPSTTGRSASGRPPNASRSSSTPAPPTCGSRPSTASCWTSPAVSPSVPGACRDPGLGRAAPTPLLALPSGAGGQPSSLSPASPVLGQRCPSGPPGPPAAPTSRPHPTGSPSRFSTLLPSLMQGQDHGGRGLDHPPGGPWDGLRGLGGLRLQLGPGRRADSPARRRGPPQIQQRQVQHVREERHDLRHPLRLGQPLRVPEPGHCVGECLGAARQAGGFTPDPRDRQGPTEQGSQGLS